MSYTKCWGCLRAIKVNKKGLIQYHIKETWSNKACNGHKQPAKWIEEKAVVAHGRNTKGDCMACGRSVHDGHNPDCHQCGGWD